jgi:hypothetical protein
MHQEANQPAAASTPSRKGRVASLVGFVAFIAIGIGVYVYWPWRNSGPGLDAPATELVKYCATEDFDKLPRDRQQAYVETLMKQGFGAIAAAAMTAHMTPEQMQRGLENATLAGMEVRWGKHLDNWLKLDAKGKTDYVKNVVAAMPPRPAGFDPRNRGGGRRAMTPAQIKKFVEGMQPDRRAEMAEFMAQIRAAHGDGGR